MAYKLQFLNNWYIHLVISVAQLELAKADPFNYNIPPPSSVNIDGEEYWEIKAVVCSEIKSHNRNKKSTILLDRRVMVWKLTLGSLYRK